jgi:hypothetical protein
MILNKRGRRLFASQRASAGVMYLLFQRPFSILCSLCVEGIRESRPMVIAHFRQLRRNGIRQCNQHMFFFTQVALQHTGSAAYQRSSSSSLGLKLYVEVTQQVFVACLQVSHVASFMPTLPLPSPNHGAPPHVRLLQALLHLFSLFNGPVQMTHCSAVHSSVPCHLTLSSTLSREPQPPRPLRGLLATASG